MGKLLDLFSRSVKVMRPASVTGRSGHLPGPNSSTSVPPPRARAAGAVLPDQEFGKLFRDLRRCLKLSIPELARRLETRIETIEALENGLVRRLPPWRETVRVVSAFTLLAKIDPRPVLKVIADQMRRSGSVAQAPQRPVSKSSPRKTTIAARTAVFSMAAVKSAMAHIGSRVPLAGIGWDSVTARAGLKARLRTVLAIAAGIILLLSATQTTMLQASVLNGHSPLSRVIGGIHEYVVVKTSPKRDGLTWIEVDDPRARRSDKLR